MKQKLEELANVDIREFPERQINDPAMTDTTIGDLHANALLLLNILVRRGIVTISSQNYEAFANLYTLPELQPKLGNLYTSAKASIFTSPNQKERLKEIYAQFNKIVEQITVIDKKTLFRLIGDELVDRGINDYFVLKLIQMLDKQGANLEILPSNHGIEFVEACEKFAENGSQLIASRISSVGHGNSFIALQESIKAGAISAEEVLDIYNTSYKKHLKIISYSLNAQANEIHIFSHAGIGLNHIIGLAEKLEVPYSARNAADLAQTIDNINRKFALKVEANEVHTLYTHDMMFKGYSIQGWGSDTTDEVVAATVWGRNYSRLVRESNDFTLKFIHGHDDSDRDQTHLTLNEKLGQFSTYRGCLKFYTTNGQHVAHNLGSTDLSESEIVDRSASQLPDLSQSEIVDMSESRLPDFSESQIVDMSASQLPDLSQSEIVDMSAFPLPDLSQSEIVDMSAFPLPDLSQSEIFDRSASQLPDLSQSQIVHTADPRAGFTEQGATDSLRQEVAVLEKATEISKVTIDELKATNSKLEQDLGAVNTQFSEAKRLLNVSLTNMTKAKNDQAQLKAQNDALQKEIVQLKEVNAQLISSNRNQQTAAEKAQRDAKIEQVQLRAQISALQGDLGHLREAHARLTSKYHEQVSAIENQSTRFVRALSESDELECANLIAKKLIPSSLSYFLHLVEEANKLDPSINITDYHQDFPAFRGDAADKEMFEKIGVKYKAMQQLLQGLKDTQNIPLPSERVSQFAQSLKTHNDQIREHRDAAWIRYSKNCAIAIGIVCTGIIPGILALLAYSSYTAKSSLLFFANSTGEEYVETMNASLINCPIPTN